MKKPQRKKISADLEFIDPPADPPVAPATAKQVHRIVTTFEKAVPVEDAEALTVDDEGEEIEPDSDDAEPLDPIQQMLADLNVNERTHSWTMIVERLPNYEKDGRYDVMAKRINCGTRPVTPDFAEDIRREFARPYKPNHFRITIKCDGKIYAHWPEALSLEPPPYEEIAEYEARAAAAAPPAITINNPGQPQSFKQMLDQFKQIAELRNVLFPELAQQPASAPAQQLTTEAALLHLVSADESLIDKATNAISRLFRKAEGGAREVGLIDIAFEAIKHNTLPQLMREFREMMKEGAQLNGQAQTSTPAFPPRSGPDHPGTELWPSPQTQTQPQSAPSNGQESSEGVPTDQYRGDSLPPHTKLLNYAISMCAYNAPIADTADWIDSFSHINPGVIPFIEAFLKMSPDEALQWLATAAPQAQAIVAAPHARRWVEGLQVALCEEGVTDEPEGSAERVAGDR